MPTTGNKQETLKAWSDIVIKVWQEKIVRLKVWDSGDLHRSFINHLLVQSGGDIAKIDFLFAQYGVYADMGVGGEYSRGNSGDVSVQGDDGFWRNSRREPKEWFSKTWYAQVMKLTEILAEKFSHEAVYSIIDAVQQDFDQRFSGNDKTVGSLRTVRYRKQQSSRNKRNYDRRRAFDGRWTNEHKTYKPY